MNNKPVTQNTMTWLEFSARRSNSIIALCVGSVEQHGPHMPLNVDHLIPYHLALKLAEKEPVIVAPPLYYGYRSYSATGGGQLFPGTISLSGQTLIYLIKDILQDYIRQGCNRFLLMNGHFENTAFISEAAHLVTAANDGVKVVIANWWDLVEVEILEDLFPEGFPGWEVEHASLVETSLVMHFCPQLVHADRIPRQKGKKHRPQPIVFPEPSGMVPDSGILYSAEHASPEKGSTIAENIVGQLKNIVANHLQSN